MPRSSRFCYWSVADGAYVPMLQTCVRSARAAGVTEDFHTWTSEPIDGAICHPCGALNKPLFMFKFALLREQVKHLAYDAFVWLDADNYFVRYPGDVLRALNSAPVHATLESDVTLLGSRHADWWGIPLPSFCELMRSKGVPGPAVFNTNAGFWMVRREAIDRFCDLAMDFWLACEANLWRVTEEAPLAYAAQVLCGDPALHTQRATSDLWASDWKGHFAGRLPTGKPWDYEDFFTGEQFPVNPAIVHAMRSKAAMTGQLEFQLA